MSKQPRNMAKNRIANLSQEELNSAVNSCNSIRQMLALLKIPVTGRNSGMLKDRLMAGAFPVPSSNKGKFLGASVPDLSLVISGEIKYAQKSFKRRLIQEGVLPNICANCNQPPVWNGQHLVLILDHINGNNKDNSLENLRLLCPNCNSQTKTFCVPKTKKCPGSKYAVPAWVMKKTIS